ncbi:uncharacterized protein LOC133284488 [Gastrolobium bilobum]|uniref:uncharacterized protein LOC133284488 n=1 Tax=Gastrolobium bilobum TaxID=150636 RepID=UPI002AB2430A|nr:uncharacterized protein LOC133284488 [Gastrolobium bilobum]
MTNGDQVRIFFNGCKLEIRMVLNGAAGGSIKSMRANETLELIERMAANENEGLSSKPKRGILHLHNSDSALAENKLLSQQMANLTSRLDKMQLSSVQAKAASVICEYCKESHDSNECPTLLSDDPPQQVQVNGNWYDQRPLPPNIPRMMNYPSGNNNFQRRVQVTGLDFKSNNYLQPPPVQPKEPSELEKLVGQMAQHSNAFMEETRANTRNTQASIRNLESQIGQLSRQLAERSQGQFPSDTMPKKVDEPTPELEHEKEEPARQDKEEAKEKAVEAPKKLMDYSRFEKPPYPMKLKQQKKFPPKLQDPGSFNIPIAVGNTNVGRALCDLGASINLMPLSICKSLGITELKPTMVFLQLADRSLRRPNGIIEDVLVKVDKFIFPADFIVLDMEEEGEMPLLLGRPFLATARAMIDNSSDHSDCFRLDVVEEAVKEVVMEEKSELQKLEEELKALDEAAPEEERATVFEVLEKKEDDSATLVPKVELKELPETLKYAFFGDEEQYPAIINKEVHQQHKESKPKAKMEKPKSK